MISLIWTFHNTATTLDLFLLLQHFTLWISTTDLLIEAILCICAFIHSLSLFMENEMATHSSTLAWKIPWTEQPGRLQSMGLLRSDMTERLHFHFSLSCIGEGNGSPLQCSCLENPRDRGAWWAAVYGVALSQTRLKRLSSSSIVALHCSAGFCCTVE